MSVINKMLQDLDRRHALGSGAESRAVQPAGENPRHREWFWRVVTVLLLAGVGWVAWIAYQILPRPLVTDLAFRAAEEARARPQAPVIRLDVTPKRNLARTHVGRSALADGSAELRKEIAAERRRRAAEPEYGTPESVGVDQSTLDAIAACESGGDPTAVDSSGTYRGKYQFDLQTWASVGGSGDPAAAPEAEQDYRAALLMSRSGSSPWPVCG